MKVMRNIMNIVFRALQNSPQHSADWNIPNARWIEQTSSADSLCCGLAQFLIAKLCLRVNISTAFPEKIEFLCRFHKFPTSNKMMQLRSIVKSVVNVVS